MHPRNFLVSTVLGSMSSAVGHPRLLPAPERQWPYDGVGTVARFGVLTPDFDPVPESELWAMAPWLAPVPRR